MTIIWYYNPETNTLEPESASQVAANDIEKPLLSYSGQIIPDDEAGIYWRYIVGEEWGEIADD